MKDNKSLRFKVVSKRALKAFCFHSSEEQNIISCNLFSLVQIIMSFPLGSIQKEKCRIKQVRIL